MWGRGWGSKEPDWGWGTAQPVQGGWTAYCVRGAYCVGYERGAREAGRGSTPGTLLGSPGKPPSAPRDLA